MYNCLATIPNIKRDINQKSWNNFAFFFFFLCYYVLPCITFFSSHGFTITVNRQFFTHRFFLRTLQEQCLIKKVPYRFLVNVPGEVDRWLALLCWTVHLKKVTNTVPTIQAKLVGELLVILNHLISRSLILYLQYKPN